MRSPEFKAYLAREGTESLTADASTFAKMLRDDRAKWARLVRERNIVEVVLRQRSARPFVETRARNLNEFTQPLHRILGAMIVNEPEAAHRIVSCAK